MSNSSNRLCIGFAFIILLAIITLLYTQGKLWKFSEENRDPYTASNLLKGFESKEQKSAENIDRKLQTSIDFVLKHTASPSKESYHLISKQQWYSQFQQDEKMNEEIFRNKKGGFFLECGALDGEHLSNTLAYELHYGWTGILIEAGAKNYKKLLEKHRKSWAVNVCIDNVLEPTNATYNSYGENLGFGELLGSDDEKNIPEAYNVTCVPMVAVFKALNITHIDYMILDAEEKEENIIDSIDFSAVTIDYMQVELYDAWDATKSQNHDRTSIPQTPKQLRLAKQLRKFGYQPLLYLFPVDVVYKRIE